MAYLNHFTCAVCNKSVSECNNSSGICYNCQNKRESRKKKLFLDNLKDMPLEKRVERLEELFYDLHIQSRLNKLESNNAVY